MVFSSLSCSWTFSPWSLRLCSFLIASNNPGPSVRLAPIIERAQKFVDDPSLVRNIVADGCERARKLAEETMVDVREAMGLRYT